MSENSLARYDTLDLVRMDEANLADVMIVEQGAYQIPWSKLNFLDCLKSGYDARVLSEARRHLGHSVLSAAAGEAHLLNLTVHRDFQRQGLGRYLLNFNIKRARQLGAETLFLEVRESNYPAHSLYACEGFNEVGRRRGYYPAEKSREDAIIMAIEL